MGCGVGRHTLFFAREGYKTYAIDASSSGIDHARNIAQEENLDIRFQVGSMLELPYANEMFDYVLAWNVVYHGDYNDISKSISEIHRVLAPNGIFQGTFLSKLNDKYGRGNEIAPNTFILDEDQEKSHPHSYCNAIDACQLLRHFELLSLYQREHSKTRFLSLAIYCTKKTGLSIAILNPVSLRLFRNCFIELLKFEIYQMQSPHRLSSKVRLFRLQQMYRLRPPLTELHLKRP
jgi:tellurite methyltransferase